jgi:hypothetical protein
MGIPGNLAEFMVVIPHQGRISERKTIIDLGNKAIMEFSTYFLFKILDLTHVIERRLQFGRCHSELRAWRSDLVRT